ncbi:PKD domain-containing protein [Blastococcus sp. SYSU D00669]
MPQRTVAGAVIMLLVSGVLALLAPPAAADSQPSPPSPTNPVTASADGLPTAQINGVGWSQAVVGNTVYVGGLFTSARPPGAAAGTNEVARTHLLAYDITTGQLTSFAPVLNGQVLAVTASPDGSRIYVGGDFTTVDGQTRQRVAAFETATGDLVADWAPAVNSQVRAIATAGSTVYLGGSITAVGGVSRNRLAAVSATDGALLPWAPQPGVGPTAGNRDGNTATSNEVLSLVVTRGGAQVVASGRFDSLNGVKATGVGALDAVTGATRPFAVNQLITNQGINSAVYSLFTDGQIVVGTGYDFSGPGNLEGSFTATADSGTVLAINDCHGDHYGAYATGGVVYFAGHAHDCSNIGGFPEQNPRVNKFATAVTVAPAGTVGPFTLRSDAFYGKPAPAALDWFPTMNAGQVTGQLQAGWSITGNGQYLAYAGEFVRVNGVDQQGLVRYPLPGNAAAPHDVGPAFSADFAAHVDSPAAGQARITWPATWDPDNETLTYSVFRNATGTTPIHTTTRKSTWWNLPEMSFTDTAPGTQYRVEATDPFGNRAWTAWATISETPPAAGRAYVDTIREDGAYVVWSMGDAAGSTAAVTADGGSRLAGGPGVTAGVPGALAGDADTAFDLAGTPDSGLHLEIFAQQLGGFVPFPFGAPETTTTELWFSSSATTAGQLFGFGTSPTGDSQTTDRTLTMGADGRLTFSVLVGGQARTVTTPGSYNDGQWHYTAATLSPAGMFLYVDGALVASRNDTPPGLTLNAHLRVGGDQGAYFDGRIDEVALYISAPKPEVLSRHYALGSGTTANVSPTATFTTQQNGGGVSFTASASDPDGTIASYAWDFGDGTTGTGASATHAYAEPGTYAVALIVTDEKGATGSASQLVTVSPANLPPTASFTSATSGLQVSVDGAGSTDSDGTVASYSWDWGDGSTDGTGVTATHAYAAAGTYTVTLTVTDDQGGTATTTRSVTVAAGVAHIARDTFDRTATNGLGTADVGGVWQASAGGTRQSVTPGVATLALPAAGNNTGSYLNVSQTSSDLRAAFNLSAAPTGNGTYVYLTGRRVGTSEYRVRVRLLADGRVGLALSRVSGGTEAFPQGEVIVPGLTVAAGQTVNARVQTSGTGPTTVRATVWTTGTEPATPQLTRTDTTAALQAAGGVGVSAHRPSGTTAATDVRVTGFAVTAVGAGTPTNADPTAAFGQPTVTGLGVAVNGSASTDADGTIASYSWNWGDGTPAGTGAAATHTYAAAGTYTITLTVTDGQGGTGTTTRSVTVAAPAGNQAPTAAFGQPTVTGLGVAVNGSASTDADGTIASYSWNWGDGTPAGTGAAATHTYAAAGTYTITLTVTDNAGLTGTTTRSVRVTAPQGPPAIAGDSFDRTVTGGLGTATVGGAWTSAAGPTRQSVTAGVAEMQLTAAGQNTGSYLGGVAQTSADIRTTVSTTTAPTGNGTYVYVSGRRVTGVGEYRVRVRLLADGRVGLALSRLTGTTEAFPQGEVVVAGLTYTAGQTLNVHVQVTGTGTTTVRATVWTTGTEPAAWQLTRTDTTAGLQANGGIGLAVHRPSGTTANTAVRFGPLTVTAVV